MTEFYVRIHRDRFVGPGTRRVHNTLLKQGILVALPWPYQIRTDIQPLNRTTDYPHVLLVFPTEFDRDRFPEAIAMMGTRA